MILCGLLSHKKLKSVWSICFKNWHDGVGRTDDLYISWDCWSDLITVIFPKSVNFREDHILIILWIFSKAGYILLHITSDRFFVSEMPRIFTTSWVHFNIGLVFLIQDECLMEPILMTSVLSKFIFNPLILEYSSKVIISSVKNIFDAVPFYILSAKRRHFFQVLMCLNAERHWFRKTLMNWWNDRTRWPICSKRSTHDDVIEWKHFSRYWPFVWGIHQSPVNSPHKGQWRGAWMFSLICV